MNQSPEGTGDATFAGRVAGPPVEFRVEIGDDAIRDLRARLSNVRWPDCGPGPTPGSAPVRGSDEGPNEGSDSAWTYGASVEYLQSLCSYWRDEFDWPAAQTRLNQWRQFKVAIDGIDLHFIHELGVGPKPMPLLLSHGWPGSIVEFQRIIPMLTDPARFGADPADAFTVVAPSLPGFTLSFKPGQKRFSAEQMADTFVTLMRSVLGYSRFAAQGGDWGSFVTSRIGNAYPEAVAGIHLNFLALRRDLKPQEHSSVEERAYLGELGHFMKEETGYQAIQGTRPQTLAFGLTDSPIGLAAWIIEKFRAWSDCDGNLESVFTKDELLTNISLYWFTGAIGSSFWPYYARLHGPWPIPEGHRIEVPVGYAAFPKEILRPPRSLAESMYNIKRWTSFSKGGHFAAMEQPAALAQEIREFFRPLR